MASERACEGEGGRERRFGARAVHPGRLVQHMLPARHKWNNDGRPIQNSKLLLPCYSLSPSEFCCICDFEFRPCAKHGLKILHGTVQTAAATYTVRNCGQSKINLSVVGGQRRMTRGIRTPFNRDFLYVKKLCLLQ